jgi:hypothetical protein
MWVQTSLAHNMVVVDKKMQRPRPGKIVLFHDEHNYKACVVETLSEWSDVPYGGQTPYPQTFPDEKCKIEGRYILPPPYKRRQGDIGEYTEKPVLLLFWNRRRMKALLRKLNGMTQITLSLVKKTVVQNTSTLQIFFQKTIRQ